jgi:two-component system sensor histidine kinase AlgZ
LTAFVFALVDFIDFGRFFQDLASYSMYIQWVGLSSATVLCALRRGRLVVSDLSATVASFVVVTLAVVAVSLVIEQLARWIYPNGPMPHDVLGSILRNGVISLILLGMVLRYFYLQHRNQRMLQSAGRARLQALQARIRPHFLFNSLNTIASLVHDEPDQAERAIENLAELFRASLNTESSVTLAREIEFTRDYIELERLRLGDRLRVQWSISAELDEITLPALTLQPLVENAIYHGIETAPGGGEVDIEIKQRQDLTITLCNPLSANAGNGHRQGNRMALDNIRQRLALAFDQRASIEHTEKNGLYTVNITIPVSGG